MRKYLSFFFLFCLIIALFSASHLGFISQGVLINFSFTILPSLAPAMLFDYLFIHSDGLSYLYQWLIKRAKNPHVIYRNLLVLLGLISGTPTLASYVEDSIGKGYLQKEEGEIILGSFMMPSLPFLIGVLFPLLESKYVWTLVFILYVPAFILYLTKTRKYQEAPDIVFCPSTGNCLEKAITSTAHTMILLLGTMIIFSFPLLFINHLNSGLLRHAILGICEFTAVTELALYQNQISFFILTMILSFASLSLFTQVAILSPSLSMKKIITKRLLLLGVNTVILSLILALQIL